MASEEASSFSACAEEPAAVVAAAAGPQVDRRTALRLTLAGALMAGVPRLGATAASSAQHDVRTEGGMVRGVDSPTPGVTAWLGIPYAAPPVGALRWRPPQPAQPWSGVFMADRFGKSPWATPTSHTSIFFRNDVSMDEDCLTINVWAPANAAGRKLPVMVWIYGGAFVSGSSDQWNYHGDRMAADDVVFVSFNYRVGIFGFFAHPELSAEQGGVSGNYGLRDQIAALHWVQRNIAAFGGDPGKVTIFGQSAGAFSVGYHLVMPESRNLFHRGIVQSGAPVGRPSSMILTRELAAIEKSGVEFAAEVGASDLAGLRKLAPDVLVEANSHAWRFQGAIDGRLVPEHPYQAIRARRHHDVPLIAGFNHDEGAVFPLLGGGTPAGLKGALAEFYGESFVEEAATHYPASTDAEAVQQDHQLFGDVVFNWTTAALATLQAKYGRAPVYFYHFAQAPGFRRGQVFDEGTGESLGAFHGAEIEYALRTIPSDSDAADRELSRVVSGYWLNFARRADPNGAALPVWPRHQASSHQGFEIRAGKFGLQPLQFESRLQVLGRAMRLPILDEV